MTRLTTISFFAAHFLDRGRTELLVRQIQETVPATELTSRLVRTLVYLRSEHRFGMAWHDRPAVPSQAICELRGDFICPQMPLAPTGTMD
jgi:hypothetical protein